MTEGFAVEDVAGFFVGRWVVRRGIVDDAGVRLGAFEGAAVFSAEPGGLLVYRERGVLELGAHRGSAQRTLHYRVTGPGRASVFFDYGDFFHDLDLRSGRWRVEHPCREDVYRGEFVVLGPDLWWQRWRVAGPAKAHTLTSDFERVGP